MRAEGISLVEISLNLAGASYLARWDIDKPNTEADTLSRVDPVCEALDWRVRNSCSRNKRALLLFTASMANLDQGTRRLGEGGSNLRVCMVEPGRVCDEVSAYIDHLGSGCRERRLLPKTCYPGFMGSREWADRTLRRLTPVSLGYNYPGQSNPISPANPCARTQASIVHAYSNEHLSLRQIADRLDIRFIDVSRVVIKHLQETKGAL